MLLISAHAFTDRKTQHGKVINAAVAAGVQHVLYTPISRKKDSAFTMPEITPADVFTEDALKGSGLQYTILGHPPFMESLFGYIGGPGVYTAGVRAPAGNGKVAPTTREDLAEAQAVVLTEDGHENKTYQLLGDPAVSFADIAKTRSEITGSEVPYVQVSDKEFTEYLFNLGMPESTAGFFLDWMRGINGGEWDGPMGDLQQLLGHKPTTLHEFLQDRYSANSAGQASA